MNRLIDISNYDDKKVEFIRFTSFWIAIISFVASLLRIYLTSFSFQKLTVTFFMSLMMWIISRNVKKTGYLKIYPYLMLASFTLIILNGAFFNGAFQAPIVAGVFVIPLFSALLLEHHGAKIGIYLNVFIIFVVFILGQFHLSMPFNGSAINIFYPIIFLAIAFVTYSILKVYLDIKNQNDILMNKMYQEIVIKAQMSSLIGLAEGMSHEINNPLTVISVKNQKLIELLKQKEQLNAEELKSVITNLEKIGESTKRITSIISALFKFSHHTEQEEKTGCLLFEILQYSTEVVMFKCESKNIKLKIECPNDLKIRTKKNQLSQAIINLLQNAIDAIEKDISKDHWIEVKANVLNEQFVQISIEDNGKGIPAELQDKIFLPFFSTKDIGKGNGLGLSLSIGIMQSLGGNIKLDRGSKNTKFVLDLPKV